MKIQSQLGGEKQSGHRPIKGVIFDLDGTLVSSELDFTIIKAQIGCPEKHDILSHIASLPSPYMRQEALNIVHQHELLDAQQANLLPGVANTISYLKARDIPMAIVTRNFDRAAALKLKNNPLPINTVFTRCDAPAKPDPSALNSISTMWGIKQSELLYVGDYLYDIHAAKNANMRSCLYAPDDIPEFAEQADYIIQHFYELTELMGV